MALVTWFCDGMKLCSNLWLCRQCQKETYILLHGGRFSSICITTDSGLLSYMHIWLYRAQRQDNTTMELLHQIRTSIIIAKSQYKKLYIGMPERHIWKQEITAACSSHFSTISLHPVYIIISILYTWFKVDNDCNLTFVVTNDKIIMAAVRHVWAYWLQRLAMYMHN